MLFLQNLLLGVRADAAYSVRRIRRMVVWGAVAAIFLLTAYGFAVFAVAVALAREFGVVGAALAISGGATALGIAIIAYVLVRDRIERRMHLPMSLRVRMATEQAGVAAVGGMVGGRPLTTLATVAFLAFVSTRFGLRKTR